MTKMIVPVGTGTFGKKGELGNKLDTVLTDLIKKSDGVLEINAAALAQAAGVKNRVMACVSALKRAVKGHKGSQVIKTGYSDFTVKIVKG